MKDFSCINPSYMYYKPLYERAKYFKETKEGVATMCKMMEDMCNEAAEEAAKEAAKKAVEATASKLLLLERWSCEKVAEYTNLPIEEVRKLAEEIGA